MSNQVDLMSLSTHYPPATRGRVVLWGMLAAYPFGGMTWQVLHYLAGLRRLGYDVWYVEDSDSDLLDPVTLWHTTDYTANVRYLSTQMKSVGLEDRWVFRPPNQHDLCLGARDRAGLAALYREADAVINLCGYHSIRPEHAGIRCLIYLQTDPLVDQVKVAEHNVRLIEQLDAYDHLFTYAENLYEADCTVPVERYRWQLTRPPVYPEWWNTGASPAAGAALTTISNWEHRDDTITWQGERYYWRKDREFRRFIRLPLYSQLPLELALEGIGETEKAELQGYGWQISSARGLAQPAGYRQYICASRGEFTVAKDQYVRPRTGWFSDRSVCYLAAARPVITQETGFSKYVPTGKGLFAFETLEEILAAIDAIWTHYAENSRAAQEIAAEYFGVEKVIKSLMDQVS
jgi:hypothetical protein